VLSAAAAPRRVAADCRRSSELHQSQLDHYPGDPARVRLVRRDGYSAWTAHRTVAAREANAVSAPCLHPIGAEDCDCPAVRGVAWIRAHLERYVDAAAHVFPALVGEYRGLSDSRSAAALPYAIDGRYDVADIPVSALSSRTTRDLWRAQDLGDNRGHGRHRGGVRGIEQRPRLHPAPRHSKSRYDPRLRRSLLADGHRLGAQLHR